MTHLPSCRVSAATPAAAVEFHPHGRRPRGAEGDPLVMLIGMFDSPFVRRVAISMKLLGIGFEHCNWSVGGDFDRIRAYNPLGRVPTLIADDGEVLIDSAAILDHLDELVGPARALLPAAGIPRRTALRLVAIAIGAAEKGALQVYERVFRPYEKRHEPWLERLRTQVHGALAELDRSCARRNGAWLVGERLTQADISVSCATTFLDGALSAAPGPERYPVLRDLVSRCESLPEFAATRIAWSAPSATEPSTAPAV
jgi:glutathione S-transferase